ncbi:DUF4153 domain-containing protein [Hespellia stercorisuis]|uniref:Uncharacterized protein n=1 Tax=Hespellia stercorisuis DSM 15480 TaxID=1121950 RepID=A0A1M6I241_9FIRM|nr:DUF4173 domain-containing protein [Hespellia stercorisuis]SHJ28533.1 protein of unknown function [Hespellia stercorisuis DSM 15480]
MKQYYEPGDNYALFGGMSLLYGVMFTFCLYKNLAGITFPLYVAATIAFAIFMIGHLKAGARPVSAGNENVEQEDDMPGDVGSIPGIHAFGALKKNTAGYFAGMMILGLANACTTNPFFILFNWIGMALLLVVSMVHQFYDDKTWNFTEYFSRLAVLFFGCCTSIFTPVTHGARYLGAKESGKNKTAIYVLLGISIAFLLLCVLFPLLLTSDMIFQSVFSRLLAHINVISVIAAIVWGLAGMTACYAFFCALCRRNLQSVKVGKKFTLNPIVGITFTSIIACVYTLYSGIQVVYLFAGLENGLPAGVTYSQYAHTGFWQLLFVSIINFLMVLICRNLFTESRVLNAVLTVISLCTFVMIASAAFRMILYVQEYNLTFLRLLVLWFLLVLVLIMSGTVFSIYKKSFPLFRCCMLVVAVLYIAFSVSKPDYQIARYNIAHDSDMTIMDLSYLVHQLSDDAAPAIAEIDPEQISYDNEYGSVYGGSENGWGDDEITVSAEEMLNDYFGNVSLNYENLGIRRMNIAKLQARRAAADWNRAGIFTR